MRKLQDWVLASFHFIFHGFIEAYGIPVTPCELANSPQEAASAAEKMGCPTKAVVVGGEWFGCVTSVRQLL